MREWPDDNRRWVIVFNMQSPISPIRHIIELHDVEYDESEFSNWYHEHYNKLDGDQFICFESTKEMKNGEAQIVKEYDAMMPKEKRREKLKKWKAENL